MLFDLNTTRIHTVGNTALHGHYYLLYYPKKPENILEFTENSVVIKRFSIGREYCCKVFLLSQCQCIQGSPFFAHYSNNKKNMETSEQY